MIVVILLCASAGFAQSPSEHINLGVYGNLFRIGGRGVTLGGIGGRVSINVWPKIQLEADSSYNFAEAFSSGFNDSNGTVTVSRSNVRLLDGLFGPKVYTSRGPVRVFATVKGGFANFNLSTSPAVTTQTVGNTFQSFNGINMLGVLYPGLGAERHSGDCLVFVSMWATKSFFRTEAAIIYVRVSIRPHDQILN